MVTWHRRGPKEMKNRQVENREGGENRGWRASREIRRMREKNKEENRLNIGNKRGASPISYRLVGWLWCQSDWGGFHSRVQLLRDMDQCCAHWLKAWTVAGTGLSASKAATPFFLNIQFLNTLNYHKLKSLTEMLLKYKFNNMILQVTLTSQYQNVFPHRYSATFLIWTSPHSRNYK